MAEVLVLNADGTPLSLVPLSTISWQVAIRLLVTNKVKVLKGYTDWVVRSQYLEVPVPSIVMMSSQVKWAKSIKYSRENILLRDDYTCQLQITSKCKTLNGKHQIDDLTLDHVNPKSHGGKTSWTNVVTCCKRCNHVKGNNDKVLPKIPPIKPTYYHLLHKRKSKPIYIHDDEWANYIPWDKDLLIFAPHRKGAIPTGVAQNSLSKFLLNV